MSEPATNVISLPLRPVTIMAMICPGDPIEEGDIVAITRGERPRAASTPDETRRYFHLGGIGAAGTCRR